MRSHRFEVAPVSELNRDQPLPPPAELIPLINVERDAPPTPSTPASVVSVSETNKMPGKLLNSVLERLKASSSALDFMHRNDSSSLPIRQASSVTNLPHVGESEGGDSCYSTIHSTTYDTNSLRLPNKFLQELRSKRRELHEKARNLSIDERIALNRSQNDQEILRAQDIFAIHFELNENDNVQTDVFNEQTQDEIRHQIFRELDRQREKQFHKQHRQLVLGRALLMFITSTIIFMGVTLIYVVVTLYDRAKSIGTSVPDIEFISMINDKATDI